LKSANKNSFVADLARRHAMLLRNHGTHSVGPPSRSVHPHLLLERVPAQILIVRRVEAITIAPGTTVIAAGTR
jgi:hypothetical protein